jgi:hypothetical protein
MFLFIQDENFKSNKNHNQNLSLKVEKISMTLLHKLASLRKTEQPIYVLEQRWATQAGMRSSKIWRKATISSNHD